MPENTWMMQAGIFAATGFAAMLATGLVLRELRKRAILDRPNARSSHVVPTPRGGGLGIVPVVLVAWALIATSQGGPSGLGAVLPAALLLAIVSWIDDLRGLSAAIRLLFHSAAIAVGLFALPGESLIFGGLLPLPIDRLGAGLIWLWFVNLFNFMDGIDGISGVELITLGLGLALVAAVSDGLGTAPLLAVTLAGAAAGFLVWNWSPARIFLGDVGSVPLGYLAGWLLLQTAAAGHPWAAIILPLYYLADATITLLRRLLRKERIWEAHREHFYQRAVQWGLSHGQVASRIIATNLALVALATMTPRLGVWAVALAAMAVAILIAELGRRR